MADHAVASRAAPAAAAEPQWWSIRAGFLLGAVGYAGAFQVINILLLRYMADTLAISVAVGGTILAITKLYDAVTDPLLGMLSDKTRSRWGRRRPYLYAGGILLPVSMALVFNVPELAPGAMIVAITGLLLLHSTAYTIFIVPYTAVTAEIKVAYHERSDLLSYRVYGGSLGLMCAASLAPWLTSQWGSGRTGHENMAWILGTLTMACCLAAAYLIPEPPYTGERRDKLPLRERMRLAWENKPFRLIILAHISFQVGVAAVSTSTAFFSRHILQTSDAWLGAFYLAKVFGNIVSVPLWLWVARRFDKRAAYLAALGIYGVLNLTWVFAGPEEPQIILFARMIAIGVAMGGCILLGYSVLADATRYDYVRTGLRREGVFSGTVSFVDKTAAALGVAFVGYLLAGMGYATSNAAGAAQSNEAVLGIYIAFSAIPGVAALVSMATMWGYRLTKEDLDAAPPT